MKERNCYVYEDYRMDNWTCCYVGMGSKNEEKGYDRFEIAERNDHHDNIMNSCGIARVIIRDNLTRKEANTLEEARIYYYVFVLGYTIDIKGYRKGKKSDSHLTNMTWGGDGVKGCNPFANKTKEEMKEIANKISKANNERYANMSEEEKKEKFGHKGEKHPNYGKKLSEETKIKMTEARNIPVIGVNLSTNEVIKLESAKQGKELGFDSGAITACAKGKRKTHKGYKWYYKSDYEKLSKIDIEKDLIESRNARSEGNKKGAKANSIPVIGINLKTNEIIELNSAKEGEKFGFMPQNITQCCKGKRKSHKGYKFYYKEGYLNLSKKQIEKDLEESRNAKNEANKKNGKTNSKKVRCIETNQIFNSLKQASEWCGLKSHMSIIQQIQKKKKSAGKHPITGEKLHWEYVIEEQETINLNLLTISNIKLNI